MKEIINAFIVQYLPVLIQIFLTFISTMLIKFIKEKVTNSEVREVITAVVRATEQVGKDIHGTDKLRKAERTALKILSSKGIDINRIELSTLIESAVHDMNNELLSVCSSETESSGDE